MKNVLLIALCCLAMGIPYSLLVLKNVNISAKLVFVILLQLCLLIFLSFGFDTVQRVDYNSLDYKKVAEP
jgi:uncharacterized membrane protein